MDSSLNFSGRNMSNPFLRDFHLHILGFSQYAEEFRNFTPDDFTKLSGLYESLNPLVEASHAHVSDVVSFLRRTCPNNLSFIDSLEQLLARIQASKMFFDQDLLFPNDVYFVGKFTPDTDGEDVFEDLWIYFSRSLDGEGDFDVGFLARPIADERDILRLATVGFMVTPDVLTITKTLGTPSSANHSALKRFGFLLNDGRFFHRLEQSLGAKAFNFLVGLLIKICESKAIPKIRGVKKELLPNAFISNIHHGSEGPLFSCGLRENGSGIFEADLRTQEGREKCFARILGKDPQLRAHREKVFSAMTHALALAHPCIFGRVEAVDDQRVNTRNALHCSFPAR